MHDEQAVVEEIGSGYLDSADEDLRGVCADIVGVGDGYAAPRVHRLDLRAEGELAEVVVRE